MTFSEDCAKYFYKDTGLMMDYKFNLDGNPLLYTSEYYVMKFLIGELTPQDKIDFERTVRLCYAEKGILNRHPWHDGQEQHDDYMGVFAACAVLGCYELGREIFDAGFFYCWDNKSIRSPKLTQCFYRHFGFSYIAKLGSNQEPNKIDEAWFKARLLWDTYTTRDGASGTLLSWLLCIATLVKYGQSKLVEEWFLDVNRYGGLSVFFLDYFKEKHPFYEWAIMCKSNPRLYF
jgi:hypothetical protein